MSTRPPSDAAVALRSLPRRFGALFSGLGEDESPDALAVRPVADGTTGLGHLVAAIRAVTWGAHALDRTLISDDPELEPLALATAGSPAPGGTVAERLAELGWEAEALADRVDRASADEWGRRAQVTGAGTVSAADVLWQVVDAAIASLKSAERTLTEARQAR